MVFMCSGLFSTPVMAGLRTYDSNFTNSSGTINEVDWHSTDTHIVCKDRNLVIPAQSSTSDTKFVSKTLVTKTAAEEMVRVESVLRLTELPEGKQFILAFGLSNIEASSGETGNVEIVFADEGGIVVSVIAYGEEGAQTLVEKQKCGISLGRDFALNAAISSDAAFSLKINGRNIYESKLMVSGTGRFGILQTGSCGAEFSKLNVICNYYDTPENVNIVEDFEDGEFNANVLCSCLYGSNAENATPSGCSIEEYNGSKVLMFRNAGLGWFGTLYQYSNFEVTFDIPYYLHEDVLDEEFNVLTPRSYTPCLGFGEQDPRPYGEAYVKDTDLLLFGRDYCRSHMKKLFDVNYSEIGYGDISGDISKNQGYSVKATMIDGTMTVQVKPLSGGVYKTVVTQKYEDFRSGYIYIWSSGHDNFAIDNFTLTNLDEPSNLIEVEYKSSVIKAEDYVPTEEEEQMVFLTKDNTDEVSKPEAARMSTEIIFFICCVSGAIILIVIGIVVGAIRKHKKQGGGAKNEKK